MIRMARERVRVRMTEHENPLAVRWDTEHEEADSKRLIEAVGDDFAIYLDRNGWQITMKVTSDHAVEEELWLMNHKTTAMPLWATDICADDRPERKIRYRPFPTAAEMIFGFGYDDK
jgi:hypothetical protein